MHRTSSNKSYQGPSQQISYFGIHYSDLYTYVWIFLRWPHFYVTNLKACVASHRKCLGTSGVGEPRSSECLLRASCHAMSSNQSASRNYVNWQNLSMWQTRQLSKGTYLSFDSQCQPRSSREGLLMTWQYVSVFSEFENLRFSFSFGLGAYYNVTANKSPVYVMKVFLYNITKVSVISHSRTYLLSLPDMVPRCHC